MDGHADGITSARNQWVIDACPLRVAPRVALVRIDAEIADEAHDLIPRLVSGRRRILLCEVHGAKPPADRVGASEHHLRERLVHDDGPGARLQIAGVKRTAGEDRRVQHVEEVQGDPGRRHVMSAGLPLRARGAPPINGSTLATVTPVTPGSASSLRSSSWVAAANLSVNVEPGAPGTSSRSIAM